MEPPEALRDTAASGQTMEFVVWATLIGQSRGILHIFLPLLDGGLDAIVHRLTDGEYISVQVKSRTQLVNGKVQIVVRGQSLVDDRALIIAGLLTGMELGETLLVVDEGSFKRQAAREVIEGLEVFEAEFSMHPTDVTRWRPFLVPRTELAARLLGGQVPSRGPMTRPKVVGLAPEDRQRERLGFLGESEVVRLLAHTSQLDLFRPFPDLEMVEVLARNNVNGSFAGLQVKTAVPGREAKAHLRIRKATFVAAESTWVVGLAWIPELGEFARECLLIPTTRLAEVAVDSSDSLDIYFHPESPERTALDPYRQRLSELGALVAGITAH